MPARTTRPAHLLLTLAGVLLLVAVFVRLGLWQLHKGQARLVQAEALAINEKQAPIALSLALTQIPPENLALRRVILRGYFDSAHQLVVDNRVVDGKPGVAILTPLTLEQGERAERWLINRGWMPRGEIRQPITPPPAPQGLVTVTGFLQKPTHGILLGSNVEAGSPTAWPKTLQWVDSSLFASLYPIAPWIVVAEDPATGLHYIRPETDRRGGWQNISYAYQWFGFAASSFGIWLFFAWRHYKYKK